MKSLGNCYTMFHKDEHLSGNLKKAYKVTYKSLHPGDNKKVCHSLFQYLTQKLQQQLKVITQTPTMCQGFLDLWWTISDSKQRYNTNFRIGNAAVERDNKPLFLCAFADWLER